MKNFFDLTAPIYEKVALGAGRSFGKIEKLGDFKKTDKVLDLAGGSGRIAKFLSGKVEEITVVDASSEMIKQCLKHDGLKCVLTPAENLPFPSDYFDKIIIVDAWHHFADREQVTREILRILKPSGQIIIEEFNPQKFLGRLIELFEKLLKMNSVFYTPASLREFWSGHGFRVELVDNQQTAYYTVLKKS